MCLPEEQNTEDIKSPEDLLAEARGEKIRDLESHAKKLLTLTKSAPEISTLKALQVTGLTYAELDELIRHMYAQGYDIKIADSEKTIARNLVPLSGKMAHLFDRVEKARTVKVGILGDNQLGNVSARLDVLQCAYDHFEAEGITTVYHTGNMIDGFLKKINFNELIPEAGFTLDSQCDYAAAVWPKKEGITTYFITGECHEGWWYRDSGINVGRAMQLRFLDRGRGDLVYVGHLEADIEIRPEWLRPDVRGPIARASHPGGGSSYAYSYKTQKSAESLQGGEKPQIQWVGHYHKFDYNYHREIHNIQTGCCCDQTLFMRKINLSAHVGYLINELKIAEDGILESLRVEWKPFYDRGFYAKWTR